MSDEQKYILPRPDEVPDKTCEAIWWAARPQGGLVIEKGRAIYRALYDHYTQPPKPKKVEAIYKITGPNGEAINGGSGVWNLPRGSRPGKWMPKISSVVACESGYHLVKAKNIADWLPSGTGYLWEAEARGYSSNGGGKIAFAQARLVKLVGVLDEVSMRLAAADMAESVLPIFEKERPNDDRPRLAIQAARDFARGKIDDVARAAAWAAAMAAARMSAAWDARAAAWAARDAAWAAGAAAGEARRAANASFIMKQARARKKELGL